MARRIRDDVALHWRAMSARLPTLLSIVIPCGPGELAWRSLLPRLAALGESAEIVLSAVDAAPRDQLPPNSRWISGPAGRAVQLNRGIAAANGRILWLLHADSNPDDAALGAAARCAAQGLASIAWFDLAFEGDGPSLVRINAWGANLRSRWFGLPFGDQGWLLPKTLFDRLGGFDEGFGRGEDLEFIVRARRLGVPLQRLGVALHSSARRYRQQGWLRTTLRNLALTAMLQQRARRRRPPIGTGLP